MASAVIGALRVNLGMDSAQFTAGLKAAEGGLSRFGRSIGPLVTRVAALGAAAAAAGAALAVGLTKSAMSAIDVQSKLARQLGGSVESVQALERAADLAGVSSETLAQAMTRLNARLGEVARTGSGPAYEALQRLGLAAEDLTRLGAAERMALLADRMKQAGYSASQMADTLRQLGIRQAEIISLVETGGEAIRAAADEVRGYGVAVTNIEARQIEQANDAWSNIGFSLRGIGNQIAVQVAPLVEALAKAFGEAAQEGGGFGRIVSAAVDGVVKVVGVLADGVHLLKGGFQLLKTLALGALYGIAEGASWLFRTLTLGLGGVLTDVVGIDDAIARLGASAADAAADLEGMANTPLPSTQLRDWVDGARAASQATAEFAALWDQMQSRRGAAGLVPTPIEGLEEFTAGLRTREEIERAHYEERLAQLADFVAAGQFTEAQEAEARLRIEQQYQDAISDLRQTSADEEWMHLKERTLAEQEAQQKITDAVRQGEEDRIALRRQSISAVASIMGSISQIINDESERGFKIAKAFAIGEALINTALGMTQALHEGPGRFLKMASIAAAGAAQIASIARAQPGNAAAPTAPTSSSAAGGAEQQPGQTLTIRGLNRGDLFSGDSVRELAEKLMDFQRNGGKVVYA